LGAETLCPGHFNMHVVAWTGGLNVAESATIEEALSGLIECLKRLLKKIETMWRVGSP
jgi:hypothetical protein